MSPSGIFIVWFVKIANVVLTLYFWVIFARAVFSWVRPNPYNPFVRTIYRLVDPVLQLLSRALPTRFGRIDFAPFILMLIIIILQELLARILLGLAVGVHL